MVEPTIADLMAAKEAANGPIPPGFKRKTWFAIKSGNWIPSDNHPIWYKLADCWRRGDWVPPPDHPLRDDYEHVIRANQAPTPTGRIRWEKLILLVFLIGLLLDALTGYEPELKMPQVCLSGLARTHQPGCIEIDY